MIFNLCATSPPTVRFIFPLCWWKSHADIVQWDSPLMSVAVRNHEIDKVDAMKLIKDIRNYWAPGNLKFSQVKMLYVPHPGTLFHISLNLKNACCKTINMLQANNFTHLCTKWSVISRNLQIRSILYSGDHSPWVGPLWMITKDKIVGRWVEKMTWSKRYLNDLTLPGFWRFKISNTFLLEGYHFQVIMQWTKNTLTILVHTLVHSVHTLKASVSYLAFRMPVSLFQVTQKLPNFIMFNSSILYVLSGWICGNEKRFSDKFFCLVSHCSLYITLIHDFWLKSQPAYKCDARQAKMFPDVAAYKVW